MRADLSVMHVGDLALHAQRYQAPAIFSCVNYIGALLVKSTFDIRGKQFLA